MNISIKPISYAAMALSLGHIAIAQADLNVGKGKVTASEIINEFKTDNADDKNTIDIQNETSRGMLCKSRGLSVNCDTSSSSESSSSYHRKPGKRLKSNATTKESSPVKAVATHYPKKAQSCLQKSVSMEVHFDYKSDLLTDSAKEQLRPLGEALASDQLSGLSFIVEGHTDAIGSAVYNRDLSSRRAVAVKNYLTQNFAFKGKKLNIIGKGKSDLADPSDPGSEKNRRVKIIKLDC